MRCTWRWLLSAAAVVLFVPAASAQTGMDALSPKRLMSFGFGGGVSVPVSNASDVFKTGFNGQGYVRLNLPQLPVIPRFDLSFSKFDLDSAGVPGTGQILSGLANLQFFVLPVGPVRPYIVAGLGAYSLKTETEGATPNSRSDTRFGVNGGAGVVIRLGSLVSAYAEGRLDNVFTEEGLIDTKQVQVVPVTFGVVF